MSFKNIYVGQTVKKIVIFIRAAPNRGKTFDDLADEIERGDWKAKKK